MRGNKTTRKEDGLPNCRIDIGRSRPYSPRIGTWVQLQFHVVLDECVFPIPQQALARTIRHTIVDQFNHEFRRNFAECLSWGGLLHPCFHQSIVTTRNLFEKSENFAIDDLEIGPVEPMLAQIDRRRSCLHILLHQMQTLELLSAFCNSEEVLDA